MFKTIRSVHKALLNSLNSKTLLFLAFTLTSSYITKSVGAMKKEADNLSHPIYGVTIDNIDNLDEIYLALKHLPHKPTARIVFDEFVSAENYQLAVTQLHKVSYIVGELADSFAMKNYSVPAFKKRVQEYLTQLGDHVDIWEIGNEVNGEWLGPTNDTVHKVHDAYTLVKSQGRKTAVTLYYNIGCADKPRHEMFTWVNANIPEDMKQGLDYVLISFYPDDCPNVTPNWNQTFNQLHVIFPNAKLGFGEIGTKYESKKADFLQHFYSLKIDAPNYVGGYFWWYFRIDMVPASKPLWQNLSMAFSAEHDSFFLDG